MISVLSGIWCGTIPFISSFPITRFLKGRGASNFANTLMDLHGASYSHFLTCLLSPHQWTHRPPQLWPDGPPRGKDSSGVSLPSTGSAVSASQGGGCRPPLTTWEVNVSSRLWSPDSVYGPNESGFVFTVFLMKACVLIPEQQLCHQVTCFVGIKWFA